MTHNNITGDKIATKAPTKAYRDGWDAIFKPKPDERSEELRKITTEAILLLLSKVPIKDEEHASPVVQPGKEPHKPHSNK